MVLIYVWVKLDVIWTTFTPTVKFSCNFCFFFPLVIDSCFFLFKKKCSATYFQQRIESMTKSLRFFLKGGILIFAGFIFFCICEIAVSWLTRSVPLLWNCNLKSLRPKITWFFKINAFIGEKSKKKLSCTFDRCKIYLSVTVFKKGYLSLK